MEELEVWKARAEALFILLDDIDTVDDMVKGDERAYRQMVRGIQAHRWDYARTDGQNIYCCRRRTERSSIFTFSPQRSTL